MIEKLDGGMIFELNKKYSDLGQKAIVEDPEFIKNIYKEYIESGANYITTCNYGLKSLKIKNWKYLSELALNLSVSVKEETGVKILGCLPPYHESYHDGAVTNDFLEFYKYLIELMIDKVDFFIMETQVCFKHVSAILRLLNYYDKNKYVYISIYPSGNIKKEDIINLISDHKNISGILINCCSFDEMTNYYFENIKGIVLKQITCGFYCNLIHEKKYSNTNGNKKNNFKLTDYINVNGFPDIKKFTSFLKDMENNSERILIGGCCGYGIKETKKLYKLMNDYMEIF